jgi:hypothetical protein
MNSEQNTKRRRALVCGLVSLAAPIVGFGLFCLLLVNIQGEAVMASFLIGIFIFCATSFAGIILAVVGFAKGERFRGLLWFALVANVAPVFYCIYENFFRG